ncbi:hypothetical protein LCGC14_2559620, partial [marine sediment metagenome]
FKPLASSGDYECGELIGEYTVELKNEAASGLIRGLSTSASPARVGLAYLAVD